MKSREELQSDIKEHLQQAEKRLMKTLELLPDWFFEHYNIRVCGIDLFQENQVETLAEKMLTF